MRARVSSRLTLVAVLMMLLLMPLAGWTLADAFRQSVLSNFDLRLSAYVDALAARVEIDEQGQLEVQQRPEELRFGKVFSGWYWQIGHADELVATSRSLWDTRLPWSRPAGASSRFSVTLNGPRDEALRGHALSMKMPGMDGEICLLVAGPLEDVQRETAQFQRLLVAALSVLGFLLVVGFILQIRWGLAPLRGITRDLHAVRKGRTQRLGTALPKDLYEVAATMNEVLDHHQALIERARASAGNLAHALKTPLANLRLDLEREPPDRVAMRADLKRVDELVEHHLSRASAAGRAVASRQTALQVALEPVLSAVQGMYRERDLNFVVALDAEAVWRMDAGDLQELVGNLLDNAAKWARHRVELRSAHGPDGWVLVIEDDGPGIPEARLTQVRERGVQLDEHEPGGGLGLSIVTDIATLYDLKLHFENRQSGGLRVQLNFAGMMGD